MILLLDKTASSLFRSPSLSMPRLLRSLSVKSVSMESTIPWSTRVGIKCSMPSALSSAFSLSVMLGFIFAATETSQASSKTETEIFTAFNRAA